MPSLCPCLVQWNLSIMGWHVPTTIDLEKWVLYRELNVLQWYSLGLMQVTTIYTVEWPPYTGTSALCRLPLS